MIPARHAILLSVAWAGLLVACPRAFAQSETADRPEAGAGEIVEPFAIGFLTEGSDLPQPAVLMDRLAEWLLGRPRVVRSLKLAGRDPGRLQLSPCYGPDDMRRRMDQGEFDLVFATAVVWARQTGPYPEPILQTSRPGDFRARQGGVLRRGVIIAGPESPLFGETRPSSGSLRQAFVALPLAVPSDYSAAGYFYPQLIMRAEMGLERPREYWFCGTDAEVVKHVVAGLADLGACREGAVADLLGEDSSRFVQVLRRTEPFPTDPVLLREEWMPSVSELGMELRLALREFFQTAEITGDLELMDAGQRAYETIRRDLRMLNAPAARVDAPRATIELTPEATLEPAREPTPQPTPQPGPALAPVLPVGLGSEGSPAGGAPEVTDE